MSENLPSRPPSPTRRTLLGMLGTIPVAGALSATTASAATASPGNHRIPHELRPGGEYDRFVAGLAGRDEFSGVVLLAHRGETVLARAYGMANRAKSIPNRIDTIFNLASASKPFTALAIMQLVAAGDVELDASLGTYLDGFAPEVANTVRVHHLLTHTSGLGDFQSDPEYREHVSSWTSEAAMLEGILAAVRRETLKFPPGASSTYSNSGMAVLGGIVAAVTGQSYYDYVREHIFQPARMTKTGFCVLPRWLEDPRIAHPHWENDNGEAMDGLHHRPPEAPEGSVPYVGNPGGGTFSTAGDLVRFREALHKGRLLDLVYLDLYLGLKRPGSSTDAGVQVTGMGYGVMASLQNGQWLAGHGGGFYAGGNTVWTIYRDTGWTGVVLSNYRRRVDQVPTIMATERRLVTENTG